MPQIRFYAPHGVSNHQLTTGAVLQVQSGGYILADSNFAIELMRAGFTPGLEDMLIAKRDSTGALVGIIDSLTGTELSLGASSKFVSAAGAAASCASGVATVQGLSATGLLDTHSLVDTVNGTILIPSDATHMSVGLRSTPGWGAGGTYRQFDAEIEVVEGVWVSFGSKLTLSGLTSGPQTGPFLELQPTSVNAGKKMRFTAKQDSGGPLTPTNLGFYAQFMTL